MNGKLFQSSISIIFLLTACTPAGTTNPVATITATRTSSPRPTSTYFPTETGTPSITPLPTIPTFTPTFDASTIVTVTQAPEAECPASNPSIMVESYLPEKLKYPSANSTENILAFLNEGGDGKALLARLKQIYPEGGDYRGGYEFVDVTGDQSSELLYVEIKYDGRLLIFSCRQGKYVLMATLPEEADFLENTMDLVDLNMNGIPEIIVMGTNGVSYPVSTIFFYEWNGEMFSNVGRLLILALRHIKIADVDGNGAKEISFSGDNPSCLSCKNYIPQRERTITYGWNGNQFVEFSNAFTAPEYRFQAIQDADAITIFGEHSKAIQLYEKAITDETLLWWSSERLQYEQALSDSWMAGITLPPEPSEDKSEYPRLAAYAYYRIMLLHFAQGDEHEANAVYDDLQANLGNNEDAQPYIDMATRFLNAHRSAQNIYDGCAAAIQYAAEHPEILIPLGSEYHGWQSHIYEPADICPFR